MCIRDRIRCLISCRASQGHHASRLRRRGKEFGRITITHFPANNASSRSASGGTESGCYTLAHTRCVSGLPPVCSLYNQLQHPATRLGLRSIPAWSDWPSRPMSWRLGRGFRFFSLRHLSYQSSVVANHILPWAFTAMSKVSNCQTRDISSRTSTESVVCLLYTSDAADE